MCPLYRGPDTLRNWNPTNTIAQHARWPTRSPATQQLATILKQREVLEAVCRGLVPTAVYTLLRAHAEDSQATAAHMQRTAVAKTAKQLTPHPQIPAACIHPAPNRPSPPPQTPVLRTVRTRPTTYHQHGMPHHTYTPATRHNTGTARTRTTGTAHASTSMRAPQAPLSRRHRPSTGTANRHPAHAPSACANGYHRRPYPATQTTGSA